MTDTTLTSVPFERIARTNQYGHFTIRNLRSPLVPHIRYQRPRTATTTGTRSEDIAFYDTMIVPTTEPITVTDTLFARNGEDSLVARQGLRFLPNDILLTWFNVNYKPLYLSDHKRPDCRRFTPHLRRSPTTLCRR